MVGSEVKTTKDGFKLYLHKATDKKHSETVIFVHHMWGNHKTTWRHYRLLNDLGYDCISFDLIWGNDLKNMPFHPFIRYFYNGIFYIWYKQVQSILDEIEGDKIMYSFSGPSVSAFWACEKRKDIKKLICDGGPFRKIYSNTRNFFYQQIGIHNPTLNKVVTFFGTAIWGFHPLAKLEETIKNWNPKIPILNIRGIKDDIVDIETMRVVFRGHDHLDLTVLELPEGKHLDGLREFPEVYTQAVIDFLNRD